jgi:hypothetical protein
LVAIGAPAATTPSKPVGDGESKALTASQILQEFAKTQDRLMSCAYTVTMEDAFSEGPGRTRKLHYEAHVRTDATRAELRLCRWGDMTIPPNATRGKVQHAPFSREKAEYRHDLWTAQTNFTYRFWDTPYWAAHREGDPRRGVLKVKPTKDSASDPRRTLMAGQFSAAACYLFGYLRGEKDRCDVVLKRDPGLRLRERREQVNGVACWVLEARRRHGEWEKRYALWFDPEHGYNLARIHTRIDSIHSGNNAWGESEIRIVEFSQTNGVWTPAKAEEDYIQCPNPPAPKAAGRVRIRVTAMHVNPDHEALKSFRLDDIREGAQVTFVGEDGRATSRGIWRSGRVVDSSGEVLVNPSPSPAEPHGAAKAQPVSRP